MREILFRGKPTERFADFKMLRPDLFEGDWVYGSLIVCEERYYICTYAACSNRTIINNAYGTMVEVIPETVGQFTGMHNGNWTKIFEGDILDIPGWVVTYSDGMSENYGLNAGWYVQRDNWESYLEMSQGDLFTIIGNIHDNPELLKGE
jgi:hypothetical protein